MNLDYSQQGRRPSAAQIISAWKACGRPAEFTVEYGETFAEFIRHGGRWHDSGNGCRGVDRAAVVRALNADLSANPPASWPAGLGGQM